MKLECQFTGTNLDKRDTFSDSDPFLIIKQITDDVEEGYKELARTEIIQDNNNPEWKPIEIEVHPTSVDVGDIHFKIICFDSDQLKEDDLIGEFYTTLSEIMGAQKETVSWYLINPEFIRRTGYKNSGEISLKVIRVVEME